MKGRCQTSNGQPCSRLMGSYFEVKPERSPSWTPLTVLSILVKIRATRPAIRVVDPSVTFT